MVKTITFTVLAVGVVLAMSCEETNHVTLSAPRALNGATVAVVGTQLQSRLDRTRSDGGVEMAEELELPPVPETVVITKAGCESITLRIPAKQGRTHLLVRSDQVRCGGRSTNRPPN